MFLLRFLPILFCLHIFLIFSVDCVRFIIACQKKSNDKYRKIKNLNAKNILRDKLNVARWKLHIREKNEIHLDIIYAMTFSRMQNVIVPRHIIWDKIGYCGRRVRSICMCIYSLYFWCILFVSAFIGYGCCSFLPVRALTSWYLFIANSPEVSIRFVHNFVRSFSACFHTMATLELRLTIFMRCILHVMQLKPLLVTFVAIHLLFKSEIAFGSVVWEWGMAEWILTHYEGRRSRNKMKSRKAIATCFSIATGEAEGKQRECIETKMKQV